jgi:LruC domain-containing protein
MNKLVNLSALTCICASILAFAASCKDTDDFFKSDVDNGNKVANSFDFSTLQDVNLTVDYSAYKIYGPVRFAIYNVNPIIDENKDTERIDESIEPLLEDYTDKQGKYNTIVSLPAYAEVLHIVTRYFTVNERHMTVEVVNGTAKAVAGNDNSAAYSRSVRRLKAAGESTNDMSKMYNFSYKINTSSGANTSTRIYKDWYTPLGTWNSASGRPDYLIDRATANPNLLFTEDEINGLYEAACEALNSSEEIKEKYRSSADLTLIKDSEVSITGLGSFTCWLNSLGYYYYTDDNKPTNPMDLNVIMLFPNTQDGMRYTNCDYNGSIGMVRGDAIQLKYYPNIAKGDLSGETTIFPKGTKIGFIVKSNGWGCIDQNHSFNYSGWKTKKMNIWAASTEGVSYCGESYKYTNTNGEARTAKFQYVAPNGNKYTIISVEDACDDKDYDDLLFALTPASAFDDLAEIETGKSTLTGVYAFEDLWPNRGDYDMNDVVVNLQNQITFNSSKKVSKQTFFLTTYQKNVELQNGLAARLTAPATSKIEMKRMAPGVTDINQAVSANFSSFKDGSATVYYLTDYVEQDLGSTYILELTYKSAQSVAQVENVIEPFVYREESDGQTWEVHIPYSKPTSRMNMSYFGKGDDCSDINKGIYYVREGNYPYAFYLSGTKAEKFFNTILGSNAANKPIDTFYPTFIDWSVSKGENNKDWYLSPKR